MGFAFLAAGAASSPRYLFNRGREAAPTGGIVSRFGVVCSPLVLYSTQREPMENIA
jgi:hypothetical protein